MGVRRVFINPDDLERLLSAEASCAPDGVGVALARLRPPSPPGGGAGESPWPADAHIFGLHGERGRVLAYVWSASFPDDAACPVPLILRVEAGVVRVPGLSPAGAGAN